MKDLVLILFRYFFLAGPPKPSSEPDFNVSTPQPEFPELGSETRLSAQCRSRSSGQLFKISESVPIDQIMTDRNTIDRHMTDRNTTDQNMTDRNTTD
jgi:hypothetical protein